MNRYWLYVVIAGILEVIWVAGLKHSESPFEWGMTIISIVISFVILTFASKYLPMGTVYAVFTGLGTAGTVLAEMIIFGEPFNLLKILLIGLLLIGIIGLKRVTNENTERIGEA